MDIVKISEFTSSYIELLRMHNFKPKKYSIWAMAGDTDLLQGWKLHISTIPTEAIKLLNSILPLLHKNKACFKIIYDYKLLCLLNEGLLGETQVGKFMTIYPSSDVEAKDLAILLTEKTKGFHGPSIMTDLRLGDVLYARYGGFKPVVQYDRLGRANRYIKNAVGRLYVDSYNIPFIPPEDRINPFENFNWANQENIVQTVRQSKQIIGPGYLLFEIIKNHVRGSVFLGLDLRNQERVSTKVIKQGRPHCVSDIHGRDSRKRLQYQEHLHNKLHGKVSIPSADPYFEENDFGYLPIEHIEGKNFHEIVVDKISVSSWKSIGVSNQKLILSYLADIVLIMQNLHEHGYIHRDISPSNILIREDGRVFLIDLELTHHIDDPTPPLGFGTLSFISPNQANLGVPEFQDDIYSLGCLMIYAVTGLDPKQVINTNKNLLSETLLTLTRGISKSLADLISKCVHESPGARPDLNTIKTVLEDLIGNIEDRQNYYVYPYLPNIPINQNKKLRNFILRGQKGLLNDVKIDSNTGLWLSQEKEEDPNNHFYISDNFRVYPDAHRGVAGVVYMLSRMIRFGYKTKEAEDRVKKAIQWLMKYNVNSRKVLPGLNFGKAGIAVAITETLAANLIEPTSEMDSYIRDALNGKLDWPDITHGAAGQGIAAFCCADRLRDSTLLQFTHRCADYLIDTQKKDGSWSMPYGVDNVSGETFSGFAHGVSGMIFFLVEYDRRFDSPRAHRSWQAAVKWLLGQALPKSGIFHWNYSDRKNIQWKWWCHGSPGIALTFLKLYEYSKNQTYRDIAIRALKANPIDIRHSNLTHCHGLSGLGDIYIEAGRVFNDNYWYKRANEVARVLISLSCETKNGGVVWSVGNSTFATADLMVGCSGILHFLLRLSEQRSKIGFPLLPDST